MYSEVAEKVLLSLLSVSFRGVLSVMRNPVSPIGEREGFVFMSIIAFPGPDRSDVCAVKSLPEVEAARLAGGGQPIRRRGSLEQGRALETLGHAVEYLIDSRLFQSGRSQPERRAGSGPDSDADEPGRLCRMPGGDHAAAAPGSLGIRAPRRWRRS
jgi:hypothetical protein